VNNYPGFSEDQYERTFKATCERGKRIDQATFTKRFCRARRSGERASERAVHAGKALY
jgi:hypothetical protein